MPYIKAFFNVTEEGRTVTYIDEAGCKEIRIEGSRSWRNNNPGNTRGASGAIGRDNGRFDIFPDEATGRKAKSDLLQGKYGEYESIRQMLKGRFDKAGKYIPGTGYAPQSDSNDPDKYADDIKTWTKLDVDNKKLKDLTKEEWESLLNALKRGEGWVPGKIKKLDPNGKEIASAGTAAWPELQPLHLLAEVQADSFSDPLGRQRPFIYGKWVMKKGDDEGLV
jgi:hypothetical protein